MGSVNFLLVVTCCSKVPSGVFSVPRGGTNGTNYQQFKMYKATEGRL